VILTTGIIVRIAVLVLVTALAQVTCFSKMVIFGTSPDVALLVVVALGLVGRYRENVGRPTRAAVPVLGGAFTLLGVLAFAAIQVGTGIDADVSTIIIRDAFIKTLIGAALAIPVLGGVRLLLRRALIEDRPVSRRPITSASAESARS
jgi:hypothetical protein